MIFQAALEEMRSKRIQTFGPTSFRTYLDSFGLKPKGKTASYISVDQQRTLQPELKQMETMVFRLGSAVDGPGTAFALCRLRSGWEDFFLYDKNLSGKLEPEFFMPTASARQLFPFQLLPKLTEASLVNLAAATGLLAEALRIDPDSSSLIPATGRSNYSFDCATYDYDSPVWSHRNGQVEVDALFVGRRGKRETMFVIEAKTASTPQSLAKHKLVYPYAALLRQVPRYMQLIPVYLRAWIDPPNVHFTVTECEPPTFFDEAAVISSLMASTSSEWMLRL